MTQAMAGSGIEVEDRVLHDGSPEGLRNAMAGIKRKESVMFWLRPGDMAALEKVSPPAMAYFSAVLSGGEHGPFPPAWKGSARLVYPYELPDKRKTNLAYFHQWLEMRKLPLVDEPLQSEVFFALNFLTDTVAEMLDNMYRDYLMERAENMIVRREGSKAEEQTRSRDGLRLQANVSGRRQPVKSDAAQGGTTIYPRLSLGPTQRFASKGGYVVRFADTANDKLVAESGWIVP